MDEFGMYCKNFMNFEFHSMIMYFKHEFNFIAVNIAYVIGI